MVSKGEIWGLELSRLSWNKAEVNAMNRGGDLWANPTINAVSTEGLSIKATAAVLHRLPKWNLGSSGNTLINIQITAAQLSRLKSMFPFFPFSLVSFTSTFKDDTAVRGPMQRGGNMIFLSKGLRICSFFKLQTEMFRLAQVSQDAEAQKEIVIIKKVMSRDGATNL